MWKVIFLASGLILAPAAGSVAMPAPTNSPAANTLADQETGVVKAQYYGYRHHGYRPYYRPYYRHYGWYRRHHWHHHHW